MIKFRQYHRIATIGDRARSRSRQEIAREFAGRLPQDVFEELNRPACGRRVGRFDVQVDGSVVNIGWSFCATHLGDSFRREMAEKICQSRFDSQSYSGDVNDKAFVETLYERIPKRIHKTLDRVIGRCQRIVARAQTANS